MKITFGRQPDLHQLFCWCIFKEMKKQINMKNSNFYVLSVSLSVSLSYTHKHTHAYINTHIWWYMADDRVSKDQTHQLQQGQQSTTLHHLMSCTHQVCTEIHMTLVAHQIKMHVRKYLGRQWDFVSQNLVLGYNMSSFTLTLTSELQWMCICNDTFVVSWWGNWHPMDYCVWCFSIKYPLVFLLHFQLEFFIIKEF